MIPMMVCPDLNGALNGAQAHLEELEYQAMRVALGAAEEALSCGKPATPAQIGRLWWIEGVAAVVRRDPTTARDRLAALALVHPETVTDAFGSRVRQAYEDAASESPGQARLRLQPGLGANEVWLDGEPASVDQVVPTGLHVVQLADPTGTVVFGQQLFLVAGQDKTLQTGIAPAPFPAAERAPRKPLRAVPLLVVSSLAAAGAVGGGVFALQKRSDIGKAESFSKLDRALTAQKVGAGAAGGFAAISLGTLGVFVARQF